MPTTETRPVRIVTCRHCKCDFEIPAKRGRTFQYCPAEECQQEKARRRDRDYSRQRVRDLEDENESLRRKLARRHIAAIVGEDAADHRAVLIAQLDRIASDGPASVLIPEVVEVAILAGRIRDEAMPDRIDLQRAVLGVAKAEGAPATRAALLHVAAVSEAWASRLPAEDADAGGRIAA